MKQVIFLICLSGSATSALASQVQIHMEGNGCPNRPTVIIPIEDHEVSGTIDFADDEFTVTSDETRPTARGVCTMVVSFQDLGQKQLVSGEYSIGAWYQLPENSTAFVSLRQAVVGQDPQFTNITRKTEHYSEQGEYELTGELPPLLVSALMHWDNDTAPALNVQLRATARRPRNSVDDASVEIRQIRYTWRFSNPHPLNTP